MRLAHAVMCLALAGAPVVTTAAPAQAAEQPPRDPTARAEWFSVEAQESFEKGKFNDAIRLYLDAYEAVPSASILYNVAFIYDKRLKDAELAIDYYDRAASASDADAQLIEKARAHIQALREARKPPIDKPPIDKPPIDKPPIDKPPIDRPTQPDDGGSFPVGPVVTMAVGAVVFGAGAVFGTMAQGTHDDFAAASDADAKRDLQSTGKTQAALADVGMFAGGALVLGGAIWLIVDLGSSPSGQGRVEQVRVMPSVTPNGAGLVLGGSW